MSPPPYSNGPVKKLSDMLMVVAHKGFAVWPELGLDEALFCQHLASRVESVPDGAQYLAQIEQHSADLFLAIACALGSNEAMKAFEREYIAKTPQLVQRSRLSATQLDELAQQLRIRVLVNADGALPRITQYTGRGRLLDWFRILALRAVTDLFRAQVRHDVSTADSTIHTVLQQHLTSRQEPEVQLLRTRYKAEYESAVRAVLKTLDADARNLLKLHFVKGLNGAQLGALLGVNRSTIMRRIDKLQEDLRSSIHEHLLSSLRLSPSELRSLTHQLRSQLSLSLSSMLSGDE